MTGTRVLAVTAALLLSGFAGAQKKAITPGASDFAAAATARSAILHPMPANTPAAMTHGREVSASAINVPPTTPFRRGAPRYPADLSYQGGSVVGQTQSHDVYVLNSASGPGCNLATWSSCWGNPEGFLTSLAGSDFVHITDQYTGRFDSNRYTLGPSVGVIYGGTNLVGATLTDSDILAIVHSVASFLGNAGGYDHVYHVFLPPGTDECFNSSFSVCYSPDKPSTFFFCAYHGSTTFGDIGHVLYSVEPYQNVGGCNVAPGSPNGALIDSTNNVLSHELFETITDPDGSAWWNAESNALYGSEIGDECSFLIFLPGGVYFDPPAFRISGKKYAVQSEYSNRGHSCATSIDD